MKLGIITFHCSHNYGAVLQAYGLQSYLQGLGHEVYIIDYRPKYKVRSYAIFSVYHWISRNPFMIFKRQYIEFKIKPKRIKRWKAFNNFINTKLHLYKYSKNDDYTEFDAIFIGSDQVWNPKLTGGTFDPIYFGVNAKCNVIAYAVSNRASEIRKRDEDYFKKHLPFFTAIGVREDALNQILSPLTEKKIVTVLDPTVLAGRKYYECFVDKNFKMRNKRYLLIYEIGRHTTTRIIAQHIANELDLEIIELVSEPQIGDSSMDQTASPEDFINYINYASYIVTTSFHGIAFSITFNKLFYAIRQNTSADIRLESLLCRLELLDRFIDNNTIPNICPIDYESVNMRLLDQIQLSKLFIENALK